MTVHRAPPGPGQESVWDYPRPPGLERVDRRVRIVHRGTVVVDTSDVVGPFKGGPGSWGW